MKNGILLGIDPGLSVSGFAIIEKGTRTSMIDMGYLSMSSKKSVKERVGEFHTFFQEKIQTNNITHLALETPFLGKNVQTFLKLGYLRGILYLLCEQHNLEIFEFSPREVKAAVTGFGGASKDQVARALEQLFPPLKSFMKTVKNDVTDAVAISLCGLWQANSRNLGIR